MNTETSLNNIFKAPVHLACTKDPNQKSSMHHVFFDNGYAIATDGNILVAYCLKNDMDEKILNFLNGKLIHKDAYKTIMHNVIEIPTKEENKRNLLPLIHVDLGRITIEVKESIDDDLFPEWKSVIPSEGTLKAVDKVGFDIDKFNLACKSIFPKGTPRNVSMKFYGQAASIMLRPIHEDHFDSYALIGSYQFK